MRTITVKYEGNCKKCGADIPIGETAIYEKHIGIFCINCGPTDSEEIRVYRQEAGDRRAEKYDKWAEKRINTASAVLKHNEVFTGDIAFNTQPGHIPFRARVIKQNDKAIESLNIAHSFQGKANSLRHVRVAGDAEKKRQAKRDTVLTWIKKGMIVDTLIYGQGIVEKINKITATVGQTGQSGTYRTNVDLSFLRRV